MGSTLSIILLSLSFFAPYIKNSKQNIIAKTSLNTKTDKIEKLSKTLLPMSSLAGLLMKLVTMVSSNGCQQALTRGPRCCTFMLGSMVTMAACSKRSNWDRWLQLATTEVDSQAIWCPLSLPCLAGALFILPVEESTMLSKR